LGTEGDEDRISIPAPDGAATLTEALRRLEPRAVDLAAIGLRRPARADGSRRRPAPPAPPVPGEAPAAPSAGERPEAAVAGELP
ncbi:daunorubicin/doxorubicin resistance ABC transporter ATP-binding protein DrrA, partial [Rhodococcus sp. 7Tela_A2]